MLNDHLFNPFLNIAFDKPDDAGGESDDPGDQPDNNDTVMPDADAEALRSEVSKLRSEAAKYRTRSKEHDQTKQRLEKLENGLKSIFGEEEDLDPEKLKSKTESLQSQLTAEKKKNTVMMQAVSAGLDPDLTIAYLQNKGKLSDLDTSDGEAVGSLIEDVAKEKPGLKVAKADSVGSGGSGNDDSESESNNLNPIEAYRRKKGLISNSK